MEPHGFFCGAPLFYWIMDRIKNPTIAPENIFVHSPTVVGELKCIATGGMAKIFQAFQPSLGRNVVVKKLKDELKTNPEIVERFRREARALATVLHQNVAHVYDFVDSNTDSYILMEYIEGVDLSMVIQKVGNLPPAVAAAILLGVARGVDYIHSHNLIHRDIKPSNIRLTSRGEVKLMDFGIVVDQGNHSLTRPGVMVGSPYYLSPEQVLGDVLTPRADIFLLGIVLYEMLAGSRPFRGEEGKETVYSEIREARFVPVRKMRANVPNELDAIVKRCLRKEPNHRYFHVKSLVTDLEQFLGPTRSHHMESIILKFLDEEALLKPAVRYSEVRYERRTRPWVLALIGGFMVLLALCLGFKLGRMTGGVGTSTATAVKK